MVRHRERSRPLRRQDDPPLPAFPDNPQSLSDSRVNCLLSSADGSLLVGTEKGINIYVPEKDILTPYAPARTINEQNIRTMTEEDSLLWVGTSVGLFRLDRTTGGISCYNTRNSGLAHDIVRAIYTDDDYLFVGTFDGVSRLNKRTGQWSSVNLKMDRIRLPLNNLVLSMQLSPADPDVLLIGTQTGFCELEKTTLRYTLHEKARNRQMVNNTVKTMCVVGSEVWLGSEEGLMIFDKGAFTSYGYDPKNIHSLPQQHRLVDLQGPEQHRLAGHRRGASPATMRARPRSPASTSRKPTAIRTWASRYSPLRWTVPAVCGSDRGSGCRSTSRSGTGCSGSTFRTRWSAPTTSSKAFRSTATTFCGSGRPRDWSATTPSGTGRCRSSRACATGSSTSMP